MHHPVPISFIAVQFDRTVLTTTTRATPSVGVELGYDSQANDQKGPGRLGRDVSELCPPNVRCTVTV